MSTHPYVDGASIRADGWQVDFYPASHLDNEPFLASWTRADLTWRITDLNDVPASSMIQGF